MKLILLTYYNFILLVEDKVTFTDRIYSWLKLIITFAPIAYFLDLLGIWFYDNKKFVTGFIVVVAINAYYGIKRHRKLKTFDWSKFFNKTWVMLSSVIATYIVLHIITRIAGENYISEGFEILLQVTTLFYPIGKILKSVFILSNGEYPPKWMMEKVYDFEKTGSLTEFLKKSKK